MGRESHCATVHCSCPCEVACGRGILRCVERWTRSVTSPASQPPDALERQCRRAEAQFKLTFLKRFDELVESYERLPSRTDLSRGEIEYWRGRRRAEYLQCVGVEIEQRDLLRQKLRQVIETGEQTVEDMIDEIRGSYRKGWTSDGWFSVAADDGV